jgi:hypothetical protein
VQELLVYTAYVTVPVATETSVPDRLAVSETDEPTGIDDAFRLVVIEVGWHASATVAPRMSAATAPTAPPAPTVLYLRLLMSSFLSFPTD